MSAHWQDTLTEVDAELEGVCLGLNAVTQEVILDIRRKLNRLYGFLEGSKVEGTLPEHGMTPRQDFASQQIHDGSSQLRWRKYFPKLFEYDESGHIAVLVEKILEGDKKTVYSSSFCTRHVYESLVECVADIVIHGETFDRMSLITEIQRRNPKVVMSAVVVSMHFWISEEPPLIVRETQMNTYTVRGAEHLDVRNNGDRDIMVRAVEMFKEQAISALDNVLTTPRLVEGPRSPVQGSH